MNKMTDFLYKAFIYQMDKNRNKMDYFYYKGFFCKDICA